MVLEAKSINGWTQHKIKDFGVVSTGTTPSTKNQSYYGGEYKLISPADLTDSKYIYRINPYNILIDYNIPDPKTAYNAD